MAALLWKIIEYLQIKELFWAGAAAVFLGLLTRTEPLKPYLRVPYVRKAYFSFCFLTITALAVPALGIIFPPQTQAAILFLCILGLLLTLSVCAVLCLSDSMRLRKISRISDKGQLIQAWRMFQKIPTSRLLPRQRIRCTRTGIYLLTMLGNHKKASQMAQDIQKTDPPVYHLYQGMHALSAGNVKDASEAMNQADVSCTAATPQFIRLQILTNLGVMKVLQGNYSDADYYFHRAVKDLKTHRKKDSRILHTVYYNYLFNLSRLADAGIVTRETWQEAMAEYKAQIALSDTEGCISVFNTELELLRQTEADPETIHSLVNQTFQRIMNSDAPIQNKCVFEGSTARIIANMFGDPKPCLEALAHDWPDIRSLPMPARYLTIKEIDLLFRDLRHDGLLEEYHQLDNDSERYIQEQAPTDIRQYIDSLPEEAILERCRMRQELAGMQKHSPDTYHFSTVRNLLEDNASVYLENHLNIELLNTRLAIMDECLNPYNLTEHLEPEHVDEMDRQKLLIEELLPPMDHHPVLAECALRLSYYSLRMHRYPDCVRYFRQFADANVSLAHFAPWLRSYCQACDVAVRILEFDEILRQIHTNQAYLDTLRQPVRQWFRDYPLSDGYEISLLLGKFMLQKTVYLKRKLWFSSNELRTHCWNYLPGLELDIDPTYSQFESEPWASHIFFNSKHHPFESGDSYFIQKQDRESGQPIPLLQFRVINLETDWAALSEGDLAEVWGIIEKMSDRDMQRG